MSAPFGVDGIHPKQVKAKLDAREDVLLLDVREPWEVELAKIDGALVIATWELARRVGDLPKDREIVVFCHSGARSLLAARYLKRLGLPRVYNMIGGIDLWSVAVDPSVPQYEG